MIFEEEIQSLINLKQEGEYWDFKKEWYHSDKDSDKLIDIICMANNLVNRDCYIIIGVDESNDFSVCDINTDPNRRNTLDLVSFLRTKNFSGGVRPVVTVRTVKLDAGEIDVIVIHNSSNTPFFLMTKFQRINPGTVYVRCQDGNTPYDSSAEINHVEYLWRKRFGIDRPPKERIGILLDDVAKWNHDFGNKKYAYHEDFPEYQLIQVGEFYKGWESPAAFYPNPSMFFAPLNIMYHSTILYETELWAFDDQRRILPKASICSIEKLHWWYYYYLLDSTEGKLLNVLTKGSLDISSRWKNFNQFLIFNSLEEKESFDSYMIANFDNYQDDDIKQDYKFALEADTNGRELSAYHIAKSARIYEDWLNERQNAIG